MNRAMSGADCGTIRMIRIIETVGKMSFSLRDASRIGRITMLRSLAVVISLMRGGWMKTTLAM